MSAFRDALARLNAPAPWRLHETEIGVILDATGADVTTVDLLARRKDKDVREIAIQLVAAVNTCAGLKAEIEGTN